MKKFLAILTAAVMTVGMAVSAFAAPSVTVTGNVTSGSAKDANGNAITVTIQNVAAADQAAVDTLKTTAGLQAAMGSDYNANMSVVDVKEVVAPAGATFPLTISFNVSGVTANSKGSLLHWNGSAWEKIATTFGAGTMTGTFSSLSPVAFVVEKAATTTTTTGTTSTTTSTGSTSPKTGEMNVMMMFGAAALLAATGMVVVSRKKKEA